MNEEVEAVVKNVAASTQYARYGAMFGGLIVTVATSYFTMVRPDMKDMAHDASDTVRREWRKSSVLKYERDSAESLRRFRVDSTMLATIIQQQKVEIRLLKQKPNEP